MRFIFKLIQVVLALATTQAFAEKSPPPAIGNNPAYLKDSNGAAVLSNNGDCWHTGAWTPKLANIVGCDGVMATATPVPLPSPRVEAPPSAEPPPTVIAEREPVSEKVTLDTDTYFDFDKAVLKEEGRGRLIELATRLSGMTVEVIVAVGHTDSTGTESYNQKLSERRAQAVKEFLLSQALPADRMYSQGKGESQPLASNANRQGRAENRRVEVEVVGVRQQLGKAN
jgi:OOP family OmpA-OmpF porin